MAQNRIDNINTIINNLVSDAGYNINNDVTYQLKNMNSDTFNTDLDCIYKAINRLYEKTRLLYDLNDNVEAYITEYLDGAISELESSIKKIEVQRDTLKRNKDTIYDVDFESDYDSDYTDRDNSIIEKKAYIRGGTLTLTPTVTINIKITDDNLLISQYNQYSSYLYQKINKLSQNGIYRVYYASKSPMTVKEKVTISFSKPVRINDFDLKLSNCSYSNLIYTTEDSAKLSIDKVSTVLPTKYLTGIEFDIICNNPSIDSFTLPDTESPDYYYNIKKQNFYNTMNSEIISKYKNDVGEYDKLVYKYDGINSGFYNDDQSLIKHANDPDQYLDKSGSYKFGNPYPKIETANIYGTKEI